MSQKVLINNSIFDTIKDASEQIGVDKKTIKKYLEDEANLSFQYVKKVFVLGKFYKNVNVASEDLGLLRKTLDYRLKSSSFKGYWLDGYGHLLDHLNVDSEFVAPTVEGMVYVDGRVFKSISHVAKEFGITRHSIRYRIQSDNPKWSNWCYSSDKIKVYSAMLDNTSNSESDGKDVCDSKCVPPLGGDSKTIRCMIDGEIYDSVKEASEHTSIKYRTLLSRLHSDSPKFDDYIILNNSRKIFLEVNLSVRHNGIEYSYDEDFETDDFFEDMMLERGIDLDDY